MKKTCTKCGETKDVGEFYLRSRSKDGRYCQCKECRRAYARSLLGREKRLEWSRSDRGRKLSRARGRRWRLKRRLYEQSRRKDPAIRIRGNVSKAVRVALRREGGSKAGQSTFDHLPYTPQELREHLESLWEPWMTWDNYGRGGGKWSIDHIVPQSAFHYTSLDDSAFIECWALSNLRPMESLANIAKGNRLLPC